MTYKILWYKKAVYHISYDIVFVIFWFTRNWTTQTQDHMNFGKLIPMVVDFATSLALYISLSCWGTPFCFELQKKMHAHQWEPLKTGYQMLPVPRTSRNHAIGFTATTFAQWTETSRAHWLLSRPGCDSVFKSQLWILWLVDSFDMWEWHDLENVISENMWKYSSRNNRDSWPCDWGYPSTSTQLAL